MLKKSTKREKAHLYINELRDAGSQERDKKLCLRFAQDFQIDLFEKNGAIYSKKGGIEKVFHKPINPKKLWTETLWILLELKEKGCTEE